jgi:hypothetical protein
VFGKRMGFVAILIALGVSPAIAAAADGGTQDSPSEPRTMWQICAGVGVPERDRCMLNVPAKESESAWRCDEVMQRARRRCMLDVLEGKHSIAEALGSGVSFRSRQP